MEIALKNFLEAIDYKITEGHDYLWSCFGPNARGLDSFVGNSHGASIIFDTETLEVYEVQVFDNEKDRYYRYFNPDYKAEYVKEANSRGVDPSMVFDDVKFIDLEDPEDFMEKCVAIYDRIEYDQRVTIPLELSDKDALFLMKLAHEQDITFNQLLVNIIEEEIKNANDDRSA